MCAIKSQLSLKRLSELAANSVDGCLRNLKAGKPGVHWDYFWRCVDDRHDRHDMTDRFGFLRKYPCLFCDVFKNQSELM